MQVLPHSSLARHRRRAGWQPHIRRWAPRLAAAVACAVAAATAGAVTSAATSAAPSPPFREAAAESGLDFLHFNGMTGKMFFPEMMGPAVALLDYDGDGDLDVFVTQGGFLVSGESLEKALFPPAAGAPPGHRLFRNDLAKGSDGEPELHFTDVSAEAGIGTAGYGIGVATGDYDNDGRTDLYLANYGHNRLLRNAGDGSFADVTESTRTDDPHWSTAAAFVDFDRDGWLDLYVVNYVDFSVRDNPACYAPSSRRDYCGPASFPPQGDRLLHNRGDGTFEDVSAAAGIAAQAGPGLGVVVTDCQGDGLPDLYVANDGAPNFLWVNRGDGTFEDRALLAGAAVNALGRPEAGMGVDADDFDNDGDEDVFLAHLITETNTLYVNDGSGSYTDRTTPAGLAAPSLGFTGFGAGWIDYDNDSWLDLLLANGAEKVLETRAQAGDPFPLDETNQLFHNRGDGTFEDVSAAAGEPFAVAEVSRAAAFGDLDDDGDTDVVIGNTAGPLRLLLNQVGNARRWIGLRLVDEAGRDALGARAELLRDGAPALWRRVAPDGSFAAASDPRVLAGLGDGPAVTAVRVHWPDGSVERFPAPAEGRYTRLVQGSAPAAKNGAAPEPATAGVSADQEDDGHHVP
jgi:hypothetical protein